MNKIMGSRGGTRLTGAILFRAIPLSVAKAHSWVKPEVMSMMSNKVFPLKVLGITTPHLINKVADGARVPTGNVVGLPCAVSTP